MDEVFFVDDSFEPLEAWQSSEWRRQKEAWRESKPLDFPQGTEPEFNVGPFQLIVSPESQQALQQLAVAAAHQIAKMLELRKATMQELVALQQEVASLRHQKYLLQAGGKSRATWFDAANSELRALENSVPATKSAIATRMNAFEFARRVLNQLPPDLSKPEIAIDPDGFVSFDWCVSADWVFSISMDDSGILYFAGLFGTNRNHGAETIGEGLPASIQANLERLFAVREFRHSAFHSA